MNYRQLLEYSRELLSNIKQSIGEFLPHIVGAIIIILIGHFIARLFSALINRFLKKLSQLAQVQKAQVGLKQPKIIRSADLIGKSIYWIMLFFFITVATEMIGLPIVSTWLGGIADYFPRIMIAALIFVSGMVGGMLLCDIVTAASVSAKITYGNILGKLTQYVIVIITAFIAIDHIGIETTFLTSMVLIISGALFFGSALAFGLGARPFVSDILASYYLQKIYKVGQIVKFGETKGKIIRITQIAVIIETSEGQIYVPAKMFDEMTSLLSREEK
jgi:small-conductance mechanosensitive channel